MALDVSGELSIENLRFRGRAGDDLAEMSRVVLPVEMLVFADSARLRAQPVDAADSWAFLALLCSSLRLTAVSADTDPIWVVLPQMCTHTTIEPDGV